MEIENKLDEDFIFYLGFANNLLKRFPDGDNIKAKCELWLNKLCSGEYEGIELKRGRNIYVSQLLLSMESGTLRDVFLNNPAEVDVRNAFHVFKFYPEEGILHTIPDWLNDTDLDNINDPGSDKPNRTYLATRILPGSQGAFAYVALSFDNESGWIEKEGSFSHFDREMKQMYDEKLPDYEMEKILAKRKDPKEREKAITFYKVLLQNIEDELDEKIAPYQNETVNSLLEHFETDLQNKDEIEPFTKLTEKQKRFELLLILYDRIYTRVNKIIKKEELLDEVEKDLLSKSIFDTSVRDIDKFELPATMWQQAINRAPTKKNLERLRNTYPTIVVDRFLQLLANYKEEIALRMHKRHENICAQMKKELRKEDEKYKKITNKAQAACEHAVETYDAVKDYYLKKQKVEQSNKEETSVQLSKHSELYDQMRSAIYDTQKAVENEAAKGKKIASKIGEITELTVRCSKEAEENVNKIEKANIELMKNIKTLNAAIRNMQERINNVQIINKRSGQAIDIFF